MMSESSSAQSPVSSRMMLWGWTALMLGAGFLLHGLFENVMGAQLGAKVLKSTSGMMTMQEEKGGGDHEHHGNNTTTTTTFQRQPQQPGLEFVFTMGLEGTGHHFMHTAIEKCPHWATLKRLKITPDHVTKLSNLLWRDRTLGGLWNIPCLDVKNWKKGSSGVNHESGDSVAKHRQIVQELQSIQTIYNNKNNNTSRTQRQPLRFPVNTISIANSGMLSYPNYMNPPACRSLNYPVIDLLFSACDEAQVQCSYVYMYRHPLDILNSTVTKRHYNAPGMVAATHMYTSLLRIMKAQMEAYPSRIRGCLGFFEKDEATTYEWQSILRDMWGYDADTFDKFIQANYQPPKSFASKNGTSSSSAINFQELNGSSFPEKHIPYLEVLWKAHEKTLNVCKQLMLQLQQPDKL